MELAIIFFIVPLGLTIFAIAYSKIHKTSNEESKKYSFVKKTFTANVDHDSYLKNFNSKQNYENENKKTNLKTIGFIGTLIIAVFIISKVWTSNPIIGKWQSERTMSFIGKSISEIEFTSDSQYALGMKFKVKYEIDEKKIIVTDEFGIGTIYEVIDKETMRTNVFGIETIYRKIK